MNLADHYDIRGFVRVAEQAQRNLISALQRFLRDIPEKDLLEIILSKPFAYTMYALGCRLEIYQLAYISQNNVNIDICLSEVEKLLPDLKHVLESNQKKWINRGTLCDDLYLRITPADSFFDIVLMDYIDLVDRGDDWYASRDININVHYLEFGSRVFDLVQKNQAAVGSALSRYFEGR